MKNREAACEPGQRARLLMAHHDLSVAFELHHEKMRHLRPVIEAYVLAGADDGSIAKRLAVPAGAIRWFRLAFYDVAHLLQAPSRVVHDLIGIADEEGLNSLDDHRVWKLIGYRLKSGALDELFHNANGDMEAFKDGGLAAWFSYQTQSALKAKQFTAMSNLSTHNAKHVEILLKLWLQEQRSQSRSEASSLGSLEPYINAMLNEIPWTHGALAEETYRDTEVGKHDKLAAELRDEELQLLAAGETVPGLEEIEGLEIPLAQRGAVTDTPNKSAKR
jgi:hypothetical protein